MLIIFNLESGMNSSGFVGGGVRRNNGEPSVGAAALWTSILWKRMEKLMDDMYNGCVKVTSGTRLLCHLLSRTRPPMNTLRGATDRLTTTCRFCLYVDLLAGTGACTKERSSVTDLVPGCDLEQHGRKYGSQVLAISVCPVRTRAQSLCKMYVS